MCIIDRDGILTGLDADDEVTVAFERITDDTGLPCSDVAPASWYHDAVQYVYENGMMNGTSDTLFSPDATVTRAMIVTILYLSLIHIYHRHAGAQSANAHPDAHRQSGNRKRRYVVRRTGQHN